MKKLYCLVLMIFCVSQFTLAETEPSGDLKALLAKWDKPVSDPNNPNILLQTKWESIVKVLTDKNMDKDTKADVVDKIISPIFDFQLMGKLALGRTNWPKLSLAQQDRFTTLFVERLKGSYRDKIMLYENEQIAFQPAEKNKESVFISMTLTSGNGKTAMLYKLRKAEKSWKIYDVEIEGVSILLTYRSQFDDTLSHGTVETLLSQLEKPAAPQPKK